METNEGTLKLQMGRWLFWGPLSLALQPQEVLVMTKKHFEAAARICRETKSPNGAEKLRALRAHAFVELFSEFSPRFDRERFFDACGVPEALR